MSILFEHHRVFAVGGGPGGFGGDEGDNASTCAGVGLGFFCIATAPDVEYSLSVAVAEPSTLALLGLSILGFGFAARRKSAK